MRWIQPTGYLIFTSMLGLSRRYLRIVFSAVCGIACVLLVVLWASSYFRSVTITVRLPSSRTVQLDSAIGQLQFVAFWHPSRIVPLQKKWTQSEIENAISRDLALGNMEEQVQLLQMRHAEISGNSRSGNSVSVIERELSILNDRWLERRKEVTDRLLGRKHVAWLSAAQLNNSAPATLITRQSDLLGFDFRSHTNGVAFAFPYWLPVVLVGVIWFTIAFGIPRWHFSLRTLLVATTLVAVGLGLIVWAVR
jgi:hypothetical protein